MKASVTFREEKSPLIRMKFPVTLAGFPLASGIVLGDNQDLALHVGTPPEACPSVKIAYQPNMPSSPLSLVVKAGVGPWGPPRAAALSVSAELRFSKVALGPFFTVHVKPRLGDFSIRKMAKHVGFGASADACKAIEEDHTHTRSRSRSRRESHSSRPSSSDAAHIPNVSNEKNRSAIFDDSDAANKVMSGGTHGLFGDVHALTPLQLDKSSLFTPMPFRGPPFHKMHDGISEEAESVDNWGNDYVKIDDYDHSSRRIHEDDIHDDHKSRRSNDERVPNFDNFKDQQAGLASPLSASVGGGSCLNEQEIPSAIKGIEPFPVPWRLGVDESIRGWSLHAHSSLPLGAQTALKIRWGVNAQSDFLRGWDNRHASVKLPYLYLQKVSVVTTSITMESDDLSKVGQLQALAQDEDIHELSPVAALCGSMKRQLQLLYAENQVLKKAMEEMKTQFEQRSSGKPRRLAGTMGDVLMEEQIGAGPKLSDHASEGKGGTKEGKDSFTKNQHDKGGKVSDKNKRNHAHEGLDALKKLGGLGRGGNGNSSAHHSMLD